MSGIPLFRVFGIRIHLHSSWIFIFLLVTWSLALGVFYGWHPEWSTGLRWGMAAVAGLLFFVSVLFHELAHSLVARAQGLKVKRITLFLFGGVSNIEKEPESAGKEFLMSIVGPVTSVLLGLGFLYLGSATGGVPPQALMMKDPLATIRQLDPVSTLLFWLGPINVLVGLFNLIPGFPLDGGRVLRSILWAITRDLRKATAWAAGVGQFFGWLMILAGGLMALGLYIPYLGSGLLSGLWLVFIGWFLNNAAAAANQQVMIRHALEDVPVSRVTRSQVHTVSPDVSVEDLVNDWILKTDERAFPVVRGDQVIGLVSLHDVRKVPRDQWPSITVDRIMTPVSELSVVPPEEDLADAFHQLVSKDVRQVPVMRDGRLVGMLRRSDILRWLQFHGGGGDR